MFKKLFKAVGYVAIGAAAVAGGMALYNKYKKSDDDFEDLDDFDDDDFDDDFSDLDIENRGYTSITPEASEEDNSAEAVSDTEA